LTRRAAAAIWSVSLTSSTTTAIASDVIGCLLAQQPHRSVSIRHHQQKGRWAGSDSISHSTADNYLNARHGYRSHSTERAGLFRNGTFNCGRSGRGQSITSRSQLARVGESPGGRQPRSWRRQSGQHSVLEAVISLVGPRRSQVGPLRESARSARRTPVGGDSIFNFSSEVRSRLVGNLSGVLFIMAGTLGRLVGLRLNQLYYAVGPGLEYQRRLVPPPRLGFQQLNQIRAAEVNGEPQTRRWRVHQHRAGILTPYD
jgi:hypothetical protein